MKYGTREKFLTHLSVAHLPVFYLFCDMLKYILAFRYFVANIDILIDSSSDCVNRAWFICTSDYLVIIIVGIRVEKK